MDLYNNYRINTDDQDITLLEKRRALIESLRHRNELSDKVLDAMMKIPRELFISPILKNNAYEDTALPIDCNQTISQPYTVAFMTTLLDVQKGDKVLEVGTGSGYQATLLYLLGAQVFSIERIPELHRKASMLLKKLGVKATLILGDGSIGLREYSPFNKIIVTAASPSIPKALIEQLATNGKLVIPIGDKYTQTMYLIEKDNENKISEKRFNYFKFVPLIGKEGWKEDL